MFKVLLGLGLFGLLTSSVFTGLVIAGVLRFVRRRKETSNPGDFAPPVSLLKPLHGAEPNLEAHLESFFLQDYPGYEILFCARQANDAGLETARCVAARGRSL